METLEQTLRKTHDWAINRITLLCDDGTYDQFEDAFAIEREFDEWLGSKEEEHNIVSMEYIGVGSEYD